MSILNGVLIHVRGFTVIAGIPASRSLSFYNDSLPLRIHPLILYGIWEYRGEK